MISKTPTFQYLSSIQGSERRQKISLGDNLYFICEKQTNPNTEPSKGWIVKSRWNGKQFELRIGKFGKGEGRLTIKEAREEWQRIKYECQSRGISPQELKKEERVKVQTPDFYKKKKVPTLEVVCQKWLSYVESRIRPTTWKDYRNKVNHQILERLEKEAPIDSYSWENGGREKLIDLLNSFEAKVQGDRVFMVARQIFEYAKDNGWISGDNPAMSSKMTRLVSHKKTNNPHLEWEHLPTFFSILNENKLKGNKTTINALKMTFLTFQRMSSLVGMKYQEINYKDGFWIIPPERMKNNEEHYVPLTDQMKAIIKEQSRFNGHQDYVFYSPRRGQGHINPSSVNMYIKRLGYKDKLTAHGIRAVALTSGTEQLDQDKEIIRMCMAHSIGDKTERSYLHAKFFKKRRKFMKLWNNALEKQGLLV